MAIAEEIVIADTLAIAGRAKIATTRFRFVEYQAPHVYFSVDITGVTEGFGAGIMEQKVVGLRPYVLLQFVD